MPLPETQNEVVVLGEPVWRARSAAHEERVDELLAGHLRRRRDGVKHPVHDFLFTYYSFRPNQLRRWSPGYGVAPAGGPDPIPRADVVSRRDRIEGVHALLVATAGRPAHFGCFGLHEWAMVYGLAEDRVRHASHPLRLGAAGTDEVVEGHRVTCSHFDAFRFFTPAARPLNSLNPAADDRPAFEQPGCLHAGMDLYKHAFRLAPLIPAELVADCFELARDIRELDMRASPYDLTGLGYEPVRIETAQGKQEYAAAQRAFAERGAPLRQRLIEECERLLAASS
ncbi:3-methyladenine DNA glycosylase [Amycolatopsis rhabdoformis]|uniref:3-methyladenine DNA glycosylase n=1 Tax=Amycolatopsis rhabdoformis TaxID=1448059 RepID=A0ABZ1IFD7_9PSEU|nr:3-methyladenine DNA glycosylase [Amycolatopsis rhabdoformis]WSE33140.1 3-methyladenine DNA glycosylase [Amycolatopsis rhabdoformis]